MGAEMTIGEDMKEPTETLESLELQEMILSKRVKDYEELYEAALNKWMDVKTKLALKRELRARKTPNGGQR
jgi:hypothetical protein